MKSNVPQIVKSAANLLTEIEKAVAEFPRKHRYSLGADLRNGATESVLLGQLAFQASKEPRRQISLLRDLDRAIAKIKLQLLMAHRLQCLSFNRCEQISVLARSCGRQCGGWLATRQEEHPEGQSSAASGQRERAEILSTAAASLGAYL